jgi:hypothetical protein
MKNIKFLFSILLLNVLLFTACDKDNDPSTEQELITTVELRITLAGPIDTSHYYYYKDLDGTGGNPPVADVINLTTTQDYFVSVRFLDESDASNPVDLTTEVKSEAEAHLVCYEATGLSPLPSTSDVDGNGDPLGLVGMFTPAATGNGTLRLSLKHEPDKSVADPCSTGDTDVDVTFNVVIQ